MTVRLPEHLEPTVAGRSSTQLDAIRLSRPAPWTLYLSRNGYSFLLIVLVAWLANYLHFTRFGLYEDDWFFVGFPFVVDLKVWMGESLWGQLTAFSQGRPLQSIFSYVFATVGVLADSIAVDYLLAFALFVGSALLMYGVLRERFSRLISTLAALLFVITPLHTLHQFLNGQFSVGPAFILVFGAMLLYAKCQYKWAYVLACLSIFSYESIFFLFVGTPLLNRGPLLAGRRREWLVHLGLCAAIVLFALVIREFTGETRIQAANDGSLFWPVLHNWIFYALASFATYLYAALRVPEASMEAWMYAVAFVVLLAVLFRSCQRTSSDESHETSREVIYSTGIAGAFLLLGFVVSYFFFFERIPHLVVTDRVTRVSIAGSFGSSLLVAVLLAGWIRSSRAKTMRVVSHVGVSAFLMMLFLYSSVLQSDYVVDWEQQRDQARQVISLSPDVQRDSVILLKLKVGSDAFFTKGERRRANGLEKTLYEQVFPSIFAPNQQWPRLFIVYSDDWSSYLRQAPDGFMDWTQKSFTGRWYPAAGRFRPGRLIVLEEKEPGWLIRKFAPIFVDGVQLVQFPPPVIRQPSLWASAVPNPFLRQFLPDFARVASRSQVDRALYDSASGPTPYVTASAAVQFPANPPRTTGLLEPLIVTGTTGAGDLVAVRYLGGSKMTFRIDHWGSSGVESGPLAFEPGATHTLEVSQSVDGTVLRIDERRVLALDIRPYATQKEQIQFGTNSIGGTTVGARFSGKMLYTSIGPPAQIVARADVRFPRNRSMLTGLLEPLVVTGVPTAGDLVSVRYLDGNRVRFRIDHWGFEGTEGGAITIEPDSVYSLEVVDSDAGVLLRINGEEKLVSEYAPYPTEREHITFGINTIGGTTAGPKFSGNVLFSDVPLFRPGRLN
jgi:hypothetical protein